MSAKPHKPPPLSILNPDHPYCRFCGSKREPKPTDSYDTQTGAQEAYLCCPKPECKANCKHRYGFMGDQCKACGYVRPTCYYDPT